jgi:hypothetical protein
MILVALCELVLLHYCVFSISDFRRCAVVLVSIAASEQCAISCDTPTDANCVRPVDSKGCPIFSCDVRVCPGDKCCDPALMPTALEGTDVACCHRSGLWERVPHGQPFTECSDIGVAAIPVLVAPHGVPCCWNTTCETNLVHYDPATSQCVCLAAGGQGCNAVCREGYSPHLTFESGCICISQCGYADCPTTRIVQQRTRVPHMDRLTVLGPCLCVPPTTTHAPTTQSLGAGGVVTTGLRVFAQHVYLFVLKSFQQHLVNLYPLVSFLVVQTIREPTM